MVANRTMELFDEPLILGEHEAVYAAKENRASQYRFSTTELHAKISRDERC